MFVSARDGNNLRFIWVNDAGCLESRYLRGVGYTIAKYIGIPFISLGEVCLLITSTRGHGTAYVFRIGGEDNMADIYFTDEGDPPHVSRLPDGDEIVSYIYSRFGNFRYTTMAIFRICDHDKTCVPISSINDDYDWERSCYNRVLYAYLPSEGRVITKPIALIDFSGYSDVISTIVPDIITCGNVNAHVEKIYDTFGDRMLIRARTNSECHEYAYYIAEYSFSSNTLTILDVDELRGRHYKAAYVAENIVSMITLINARNVVRKMINMIDQSEYIFTDSV